MTPSVLKALGHAAGASFFVFGLDVATSAAAAALAERARSGVVRVSVRITHDVLELVLEFERLDLAAHFFHLVLGDSIEDSLGLRGGVGVNRGRVHRVGVVDAVDGAERVAASMLSAWLFIHAFYMFPMQFRLYLHPPVRVGVEHSCRDYWLSSSPVSR